MPFDDHKLDSPTGAKLHLYVAKPEGTPKAVVQINHGMAEHGARYDRFADALTAAGYAAVAHDHRGHGQTEAPDASPGIFAKSDGWEKVIADVHAVNQRIADLNPGVPGVCFGHSMGAIITLNYSMRHPDTIVALAAWNAGVETGVLGAALKMLLKAERMFKGSDVPSSLAKKLTFDTWNKQFAPNRTDFDWLSRDEAEVDKYVADPLCGFDCSIGLWLDLLEGIYFAADDQNLKTLPQDMPVHLQAGADDPCSEKGRAVTNIGRRMKKAGMTDATFNLLSGTRHESLNEVNREETTARFVGWLNARFG